MRERRIQRWVSNHTAIPTIGVVTAEVARNFLVAATYNQKLPPFENIPLHYTGDFSAAFVGSQVLDSTVFSRIKNNRLRRGLSVSIPAGGMAIAEISQLNQIASHLIPILGNPDAAQLPAGIVGLAAWWALLKFLDHRAVKKIQ